MKLNHSVQVQGMAFHLFKFTLGFFRSILKFSSHKFCTFLVNLIYILSFSLLLRGAFLYHYILELVILYVCMLSHFNHVSFGTLRTIAGQTPLSMEFSRQEYWSGLPCPPPWDLSDPGIKPVSPAQQIDSFLVEPLGKFIGVFKDN